MHEFKYVQPRQIDTLLHDIQRDQTMKQRYSGYRKWRRRQRIGAVIDWMLAKVGL